MQRIFLSYRHDDAPGYAARLADSLESAFGADAVFRDVDSVIAGSDWKQVLTAAIHAAKVLVAVIGPSWANKLYPAAKGEPDWVRYELDLAWNLGIPIIPVTVGNAQLNYMQDLNGLDWLTSLQVYDVSDIQQRWKTDICRLIQAVSLATGIPLADPHAVVTSLPITDYGTRLGNFFDEYLGKGGRPIPFGGRSAEMAKLDSWLVDESSPDFMLVAGPAGRGKSALLTRWSTMVDRQEGDIKVVIIPINIRFRTNLANVVFPTAVLRLAALHGESIHHESIPSSEVWRAMLGEYLAKPLPSSRKLLVVFDGLDEAAGWEAGPDLFPIRLAPNTKVLVSARYLAGHNDSNGWLQKLGWNAIGRADTLDLRPLSVGGVADVLKRMSFPFDRLEASAEIVSELYRLTEGDPLLMRFYVDDLWAKQDAAARLEPKMLSELSPGLGNYLNSWLQEQYDLLIAETGENPQPLFETVLNILACAMGPLFLKDLHALIPENFGSRLIAVERVLRTLARFVIGDGKRQGYIFSHPRLADYHWGILVEAGFADDQDSVFVAWGSSILDEVKQGDLQIADVPHYVVQYYRAHLDRVDAKARSYVELLGNVWFQAWSHVEKGSYSGFLSDVESVWKRVRKENESAAAKGEIVPLLGAEFRCAICRSSISSLVRKVPASLIVELVDRGIWSIAHVTTFSRYLARRDAVSLLVDVEERTLHPQRQMLLIAALEIMRGIEDDSVIENLVSRMGSALGGELEEVVLEQSRALSRKSNAPLLISSIGYLEGSARQARLVQVLLAVSDFERDDSKRAGLLLDLIANVDLEELLDGLSVCDVSIPELRDNASQTKCSDYLKTITELAYASELDPTDTLLSVLKRRWEVSTDDERRAVLDVLSSTARIEGIAHVVEAGLIGWVHSIPYALTSLSKLSDPRQAIDSIALLRSALERRDQVFPEVEEFLAYSHAYACLRLVLEEGGLKRLSDLERNCSALDNDDRLIMWQLAIDKISSVEKHRRGVLLLQAARLAPAEWVTALLTPSLNRMPLVDQLNILCVIQSRSPNKDHSKGFLNLVEAAWADESLNLEALTVISMHSRGSEQMTVRSAALLCGLFRVLDHVPREDRLNLTAPLIPLLPDIFLNKVRAIAREFDERSDELSWLEAVCSPVGGPWFLSRIIDLANDTPYPSDVANALVDILDLVPSESRLKIVQGIFGKEDESKEVRDLRNRAEWVIQNAFRLPGETLSHAILSIHRLDLARYSLNQAESKNHRHLCHFLSGLSDRIRSKDLDVEIPGNILNMVGALSDERTKVLLILALSCQVRPQDVLPFHELLTPLSDASRAECMSLLAVRDRGLVDPNVLAEALDLLCAVRSDHDRSLVFERIAGHAKQYLTMPEIVGSTLAVLNSFRQPIRRLRFSQWLLPRLPDIHMRVETKTLINIARTIGDVPVRTKLLVLAARYLHEQNLVLEAISSHVLWILSKKGVSEDVKLKLQLLLAAASERLYSELIGPIIDSAQVLENGFDKDDHGAEVFSKNFIVALLQPLKKEDVNKFLVSALAGTKNPATDLIEYLLHSHNLTQALVKPLLRFVFQQPDFKRRAWLGELAKDLVEVEPDILSISSSLHPINALELCLSCQPYVDLEFLSTLLTEEFRLARQVDIEAPNMRAMIEAALELEARPMSLMSELAATLGRYSNLVARDELLELVAHELDDEQLVKVLAVITEIGDGENRASAILSIGSQAEDFELSQVCADSALLQAETINGNAARAAVFLAIASQIDDDQAQKLYLEALLLARRIAEERDRVDVLKKLANDVRRLAEECLTQLVVVVETIENHDWRIALIKKVYSYLPGPLKSNVLVFLKDISKKSVRHKLLIEFVGDLPEQWHYEALSAALKLHDDASRGRALQALISSVSGEFRFEVLQAARSIQSLDVRSETLFGMALRQKELWRGWILDEALSAVACIGEELVRAQVFCGLISRLPKSLLGDALDLAGGFRNEFHRARTLGEIALHLPASQLARALGFVNEIADSRQRQKVIRRLAPLAPPSLLEQAHRAVIGITEPRCRALALKRLSGRVSTPLCESLLEEALDAVRQIEDEPERVAVLVDLVPDLSAAQRSEGFALIDRLRSGVCRVRGLLGMASAATLENSEFDRILAILEQIRDEEQRLTAIVGLGRHLPEVFFGRILNLVRALPAAGCRSALGALAVHVPSVQIPEVVELSSILGAGFARTEVLCPLLRHLPERERNSIIAEALEKTESFMEKEDRVRFLMLIGASLDVDNGRPLCLEALSLTRQIVDDQTRSHIIGQIIRQLGWFDEECLAHIVEIIKTIENLDRRNEIAEQVGKYLPSFLVHRERGFVNYILKESLRREKLFVFTPDLPPRLLDDVLSDALSMTHDAEKGDQLVALMPVLSINQRSQAVDAALKILNRDARAGTLVRLGPWIDAAQRSRVFAAALSTAGKIEREDVRADVLRYIIPQLPKAFLDEALELAGTFRDEAHRAHTLGELALYLPASRLQRAMGFLDGITDTLKRRRVTRRLAPLAPLSLIEEAHGAVSSINQPRCRALALQRLSVRLSTPPCESLLDEALDAVRQIEDEAERIAVLVDLVPDLSATQRSEGFSLIDMLRSGVCRVRGLVGMASAATLENSEFERILAIVEQIQDEEQRLAAVVGLGRYLPDVFFGRILNSTVKKLPVAELRLALKSLAVYVPAVYLPEVVELTNTLGAGFARAEVLCLMLRHLPESARNAVSASALEAIASIIDVEYRVQFLFDLEPVLPEAKRDVWLDIVEQIDEPVYRAEAYRAISRPLAQALEKRFLSQACGLGEPEFEALSLFCYSRYLSEQQLPSMLEKALDRLRLIDSRERRLDTLVVGIKDFQTAPMPLIKELYNQLWNANNEHLTYANLLLVITHIPPDCWSGLLQLLEEIGNDDQKSQLLRRILPIIPVEYFDDLLAIGFGLKSNSAKERFMELAAELATAKRKDLVRLMASSMPHARGRGLSVRRGSAGEGRDVRWSMPNYYPRMSLLPTLEKDKLLTFLSSAIDLPNRSCKENDVDHCDSMREALQSVTAATRIRRLVTRSCPDGDVVLKRLRQAEFDGEKLAIMFSINCQLTEAHGREILGLALEIQSDSKRVEAVQSLIHFVSDASWLRAWLVAAQGKTDYARSVALEMIEVSHQAESELKIYERWSHLIERASEMRRPHLLETLQSIVPAVGQISCAEQSIVGSIVDSGAWWP